MKPETIDVSARHIVHLGISSCLKEGDYNAAFWGVILYPLAVLYAWIQKRKYNSGNDPYP